MTSSKSIGCCPADETFTIRAGALFLINGNSSNVSRKPARIFEADCRTLAGSGQGSVPRRERRSETFVCRSRQLWAGGTSAKPFGSRMRAVEMTFRYSRNSLILPFSATSWLT
jgi:hypothetical protein